MNTLHSKSPCCQGKIYNFGQRRRQCSICKKTWRVRQKKKGRKHRRVNDDLIKHYLSNGGMNLKRNALKLGVEVPVLRYRIRKSLDHYLKKESFLKIPKQGELIIIADALMEEIQETQYVTHIILLRPVKNSKAIILEPYTTVGFENSASWMQALMKIPLRVRKKIVALVVDGKPCFKGIAASFGWQLQRCHFHLFAELYKGTSFKRRSKSRKAVARMITLTRQLVTEKNEKKALRILDQIYALGEDERISKRIKLRFISGLKRNLKYHRTYLRHPELNLPTTTNSCEAIAGNIRKLLRKANGFSTCNSYSKWVKALLLFQKTIQCKGTKVNQKK